MKAGIFFLLMGYYGAVWAQPVFTSTPVTSAKVGISYAYTITVEDDPLPSGFTLELIDGPPGLSLSVIDSDEALLQGVPENAGSFNVTVRATNDDDAEFTDQSFELTIAKGDGTITLTDLAQTYSDQPLPVGFTTDPPGLSVTITYNGSNAAPANAGNYVVLATIDDTDYSGSTSAELVISQKELQVGVVNVSRIFNTENPSFEITYAGFEGDDIPADLDTSPVASTTAITESDVGTYSIDVSGGNDQNYTFVYTPGQLEITPAPASLTLSGLSFVYDGQPKSPSVTTTPAGLNSTLTFNGSASLPVNAGTYTVNAVIDELNYEGTAQAEMIILPAEAEVEISNLNQNFDGNPKAVSVSTIPAGLDFEVTYDGVAALPVDAGVYDVTVTIVDPNYTGLATGVLVINSPPQAGSIADRVVNEDDPDISIPLNPVFDDTEDPDQNLIMTVSDNTNPALFDGISVNSSNELILSLARDQNGSASITVRATDTGGLFAESAFTITVNPIPDAPEFVSTPITGGVQGQEYIYDIIVNDPDANEVLSFVTALPSWLTFEDFGDGTGRLSGTPGNDEVGSHVVALEVTDKDGLQDTQFFNIIVGNSNDAPFFTSIPVEAATENVLYTYNITTSDPDGDSRSISGVILPDWLSLTDNGNGTGVLSGTPLNDDGGENEVRIRVEDIFGAQAEQSFVIRVDNTNNPPLFTTNPVTSVQEDQQYVYDVAVDDPDVGDVLSISVLARPEWLEAAADGERSIILSGTPQNEDVGTSNVVLTVTDAEGAQANQNFTITVINVNDPPVFNSSPVTAALQGVTYTYSISTADPDAGDSRIISASEKPAWLQFEDNGNGTALLEGTPGNDDFGQHPVSLQVTDNNGATATQSFTINVDNVNDSPVFTSTPVTAATEDVEYIYSIVTADPDDGDTRAITALALPGWLTLDDNGDGTASLQGIPRNAQVGNHSVVLNVRDALGANTNQNFTITVTNTNDPPVFISTPVTSALQDVEYRYEIRTNDVDANDSRTVIAETLPGWLSFTDLGNGNAVLSGIPRNTDLGANPVKLRVTDAAGSTAFQNFAIEVDNTNDPPVFTSSPVSSVLEDAVYVYNVTASDPDGGDNLTLRAVALPDWLNFTDNGDRTGLLTGTPANQDVGTVSVVLTVEDAQGLLATQNFSINVINTNDPPVFASTPLTSAIQNVLYRYSILTTDPDAGDQRSIEALTLPSWLTLTDLGNGSAVLEGTPTNQDLGQNPVELRVQDALGAATDQVFTINVDNINDAPSFTSTPITEVAEDALYEYLITTQDPDQGDSRTISALSKPVWLDLTDNGDGTAILIGQPLNEDVGSHSVVLNVRDGLGANANQSFTIIVENTNDAPFFSSQPIPVAVQGALYNYDIQAIDPDVGDVLTMQALQLPGWLSFTDNGNGNAVLSGTPGNDDLGSHEVIIEVFDREGAASQQLFTINVDNANDPPSFTSAPVTSSLEDDVYEYFISTTDPDLGDIRTVSALSIPGWLNLEDFGDGTALLSGVPLNSDVGVYSIVLRVDDALGLSEDQSFQLTVQNTNDAPVFTSQPVLGAIQGAEYIYNINTEDVDEGDVRSIALLQGPGWISLSDNGNGTAILSGTPLNQDLGLTEIIIEVTDEAGAATTQVFQINVDNQNDPPVFSSNPVLAVNQGDLYQYLVNTEDPDQNDTRVIRALTLPSWMTIEDRGDGTALVFGEPTNEEVGTHSVVLEVTDALGSKDTQTFSVEVININDAPRFTSEPINIARVGETYEYEITVIDIDANAVLEVAANGLPGWLSLGDLSDGRALLSGIPPVEEVNKQFDIQIVVTDDGGLQSDQQFTLRTEYPNIPPTIQQISDITGIPEDSEPLQITLSGISAGGGENQALSVAATASNNELFSAVDIAYTSPSANGLLTLTPAPNAFGTSEITITVTDDGDANLNTFAISFNVSIDAVNDAPEFVSSPVTKLSLGEPYTYAIETRDDDPDDVLAISSLNLPSWLTLLDNGDGTALLEGTAPDNAEPIEITLLVSDNAGAQTEQTFILQVNRRPELQDVFIAAFEDSVYVFKLADFLTGYFDANDDVPQGIRIQELPVHGVLTFNGSAVVTDQVLVPSNGTLSGLEYLPDANFNGTDEFLWNISDGEVEAAEPASMILDVQPVNDPPVISNLESAPIRYSQGQGDVFVTVTATITDIDDNQISGARVSITSNYVRGEDVLQYTRELTPGISVDFDEQNGILSFDGISTKSQYDVALNNVRYRNNRVGEIDLTTKEISIQAIDEDGLGPRAVRLIQITEVFPELDLVNAFTPNGDGVNDVWDIGNLPAYRNAALSIFDGNGNEVYQCNGTDCVWDGKMGGRILPAGPYYYVIKLNDGQQVYRGTVSILK